MSINRSNYLFGVLWICFMFCYHQTRSQADYNLDSLKQVILTSKDEASVILSTIVVADQIFYSQPDSALQLFIDAEKRASQVIENPRTSDSVVRKFQTYLAFAYFEMGSIYHQRHDITNALKQYSSSLKIYEKLNKKYGIAGVLNSIGVIYEANLNDHQRAMESYSKALSLYEELNDTANAAIILSNIGAVYKSTGDANLALDYFLRSRKIFESHKMPQGLAEVTLQLAEIYKERGQLNQAITECKKSIWLYKTVADMQGEAQSKLFLANIYLTLGQLKSAGQLASSALDIAKKNNYRTTLMESALLLHHVFKKEGDLEKRASMLELYLDTRDSLENKDVRMSNLRDLIYFENRSKSLDDSIKSMNTQQSMNNKIHAQQITIERQQKFRTIFISIGLTLVFIMIILLLLYRRNMRQKQNLLLVTSLEMEQKLLRAQMNPHFIFNSLNSIQSLILKNESNQAREYLGVFSKLTRAVLDQTRKKSIALNKEIETLKLYLEMEKLRFRNKFDYHISVDEMIASENTFIPPLLIQPFVENSIFHGISHKMDKGTIQIDIKRENGLLTCSVQDDGVGRARAEEINLQSARKLPSVATQLARSRLKLISPDSSFYEPIQIIDLFDEQSQPSGTRVVIKIKEVNNG